MDLELPPVTAQDDAAPTAVHVVTPALSRHSRRFAARQRHLQRAIKAAAADGTGGPDDTEHARGGAAWATLGDTISPGCGQWPEGGGGGGGAVGGESGSSIFSTPTCTLPFRALPPATHADGPLTTPGPPALGVNRTAYATAPPQDQDPRELGDLN